MEQILSPLISLGSEQMGLTSNLLYWHLPNCCTLHLLAVRFQG